MLDTQSLPKHYRDYLCVKKLGPQVEKSLEKSLEKNPENLDEKREKKHEDLLRRNSKPSLRNIKQSSNYPFP